MQLGAALGTVSNSCVEVAEELLAAVRVTATQDEGSGNEEEQWVHAEPLQPASACALFLKHRRESLCLPPVGYASQLNSEWIAMTSQE